MTLYLEYVLLDNLIINSIIILLTVRTCRLKSNWINRACANVCGTALAIAFPLLNLSASASFAYKILCGLLMCFLFLKPVERKKIVWVFLFFLLFTFCMGGLGYSLVLLSSGTLNLADGRYSLEFPVGILILPIAFTGKYILVAVRELYKKAVAEQYVYKLEIETDNARAVIDAFYDSGNTFTDEISNKPVIILSFEVLEMLKKNVSIADLILKKPVIENSHYSQFSTLAGSQQVLIFPAKSLKLKTDNKTILLDNFVLGVITKNISRNKMISGLLHSSCL